MNRSQWLSLDPARLVPEIDYGTRWTDHNMPQVHRVVTWNPGTGELYSFTHGDGDDVEVHAIFSRDLLDTAIAGWQQRVEQPESLGWLRRVVTRAATLPPPVFGLVVAADGGRRAFTAPVPPADASQALGATVDLVATEWPGDPPCWLTLYIDTDSHRHHQPANYYASVLYGADRYAERGEGWAIEGDVVVCCANPQLPLPDDLVHHLLGAHVRETSASRQRPGGWVRHDLDTARRFQAAYCEQPVPADPFTAQMRADNERDIVLLVAELKAAGIDTAAGDRPPRPAPDPRPPGAPPTDGLSL